MCIRDRRSIAGNGDREEEDGRRTLPNESNDVMHILFIHQAYPAQFGLMAEWMARSKKHRVTFLSADPSRWHGSIENIRYQAPPEPRRGQSIPWPQEFEKKIQHCRSVVTALKKRPDIRSGLIVGHSG